MPPRARAEPLDAAQRLRLALGPFADVALGSPLAGDAAATALEAHLAYLYDRAYDPSREMRPGRDGGLGSSLPSAPEWLAEVRTLLPRECMHLVERDAVQRFGLTELLTDPATLASMEPSEELLKLLLQFRSKISPAAHAEARRIVAEVARALFERLATQVRPALTGPVDRARRTRRRGARALDIPATLRANLRHFDREKSRLGIEHLVFRPRKRTSVPWTLIVLVDQSASMLDSVIHAAITSAVFASVRDIRTRLVAFDTTPVDLTHVAHDPVEVLFSVQLGGGTDIGRAVGFASRFVTAPRRTILVLVSDFYEGPSPHVLVARVKDLVDAGVRVLGVAALGREGAPAYDARTAAMLAGAGAHVAAMTPRALVEWVARHVRGGGG